MPVRIYDLAKDLGIESKLVLAKAKALGMTAAKVPSSSLDKITAEFLKEELIKEHPQAPAAAPAPVQAVPIAPSPPTPITIISEPAQVLTSPVETPATPPA